MNRLLNSSIYSCWVEQIFKVEKMINFLYGIGQTINTTIMVGKIMVEKHDSAPKLR